MLITDANISSTSLLLNKMACQAKHLDYHRDRVAIVLAAMSKPVTVWWYVVKDILLPAGTST
jgi:hypothetical protein